MIDRQQTGNIDWILIGLLILISAIGVAFIYSSSHYLAKNYYMKQILWIVVSLVALIIFLFIDYHFLVEYSIYIYILFLIILICILFFGNFTAGAKSWIKFSFFKVQPSELIKVIIILLLARIFSGYRKKYITLKKGFLSGAIVFFPVLLTALQPDLGTALIFIPILLASLILAGINKKTFVFLLIFIILVSGLSWHFLLKDYQKDRLTTLVFPEKDPLGSGYQILQSKIAIGSGGLLGKGYKKGTQSQLRFLPARHTDFILSVIGEELGFIGVTIVLIIYFLFIYRLFQSILKSRDRTGVYIIFMVAVMISAQFFINVLMTIGLFPISGIPLPLLSYGGSSLLSNYLAISLVLNVKMRRFANI